MAATPRYKVYNSEGEYVAACKYLEDAAAVCGMYPEGATIRDGHAVKDILYTNRGDSDSYDEVRDKALAEQERQQLARDSKRCRKCFKPRSYSDPKDAQCIGCGTAWPQVLP
jgi:hypothetical protein